MKVVEEIRRERLKELLQERGSYVALNALLGLNARDSTLNQIVNQAPNSKSGTIKSMGSEQARRLEDAAKKERGWMDNDPAFDSAWPFPLVDRSRWQRLSADDKAYVQSVMNLAIIQREPPAVVVLSTGEAAEAAPRVVHDQKPNQYGT
jgi:hypothetical protein